MRGTEEWNYIIAAVLIGLASIGFVLYQMKSMSMEEAESERVAQAIALHINSLTAVEKGSVTIKFNKPYDIAVEQKRGFFEVTAKPYENGKRGREAKAESIGDTENTKLKSVTTLLISREPGEKVKLGAV